MTFLVALALATAVELRPVLASRVTSGKKRLTVLIGTTTLRGSMESDAFAEPAAGDGDCPFAISKRGSITTMTSGEFYQRWLIPHVANLRLRHRRFARTS